MDESLEGWYTDPFGRHEARWISSGRPTSLVRDGDVESRDEPPDEAPHVVPERIAPHGARTQPEGPTTLNLNIGTLSERSTQPTLQLR